MDKNRAISIGIFIAIILIAVVALFSDASHFEGAVQVIMLPILLFAVVNIIASIFDGVVEKCKNKSELLWEKRVPYENEKRRYEHWLSLSEEKLNEFTNEYDKIGENDKSSEARKKHCLGMIAHYEKDVDEYKKEIEGLEKNSDVFGEASVILDMIANDVRNNKPLFWVYSVSFALLFLGLALSPMLSTYFRWVPMSALSLLALSLSMGDILLKEFLVNWIFDKKFNKEKEKVIQERKSQEDTPNE